MFKSSFISSLLGQNRKSLLILFLGILCAGGLELLFVLSIRFLLKTGLSQNSDSELSTPYLMMLIVPLCLVSGKAAVQWKVTQGIINFVERWYQNKRTYWLKVAQETAYPLSRASEVREFKNMLLENLFAIRTGALSVFLTAGSLFQLLLFIPLLFFFPLKLSLIVLLLILPVVAVSQIRIKLLRKSSDQWIYTSKKQRQVTQRLGDKIRYFTGNNKLRDMFASYDNTVFHFDKEHSKWEFTRSLFPTLMELVYFGMLCLVFGIFFLSGVPLKMQPWDWVPFVVLILLMYRPIREWSRFYPSITMGHSAWSATQLKIKTWEKFLPRPPLLPSLENKIQISELSFGYSDKLLFKNFSLNIDPQKISLISGPNGSGKSTLMNLICRTEFPLSGNIYYPQSLIYADNISLTWLPQPVNCDDNILNSILRYRYEFPEKWSALEPILNIDDILNTHESALQNQQNGEPPETRLSGGEYQRLCLAGAFMSNTNLLLLDEPTTWLPGTERIEIMENLFTFWQEHSPQQTKRGILVASHEHELKALCDKEISLSTTKNFML